MTTDCIWKSRLFVNSQENWFSEREKNWGDWRLWNGICTGEFEKIKGPHSWPFCVHLFGRQVALWQSWSTGDVQSSRLLEFRPSWRWKWCPRCSSGRKRPTTRSRSRPVGTWADQNNWKPSCFWFLISNQTLQNKSHLAKVWKLMHFTKRIYRLDVCCDLMVSYVWCFRPADPPELIHWDRIHGMPKTTSRVRVFTQ